MKFTKRLLPVLALIFVMALLCTACGEGKVTPTDTVTQTTASVSDDASTESQTESTLVSSAVSTSTSSKTQSTDKTQLTKSDAKRVSDCLKAAMEATDEATVKSCMTQGSYSKANSLVDYYPDTTYSVTVEKVGSFQNYDLYSYTAKGNNGHTESSVALMLISGNDCLLCVEDSVANQFKTERACGTCGGAGRTGTLTSPCGACGGQGYRFK